MPKQIPVWDDNGNRPTLLLAEDHPKMARTLGELLAKDFDIVAVVPDGERLIALAAHLHPAVIVADISLEGLDGISATQQILQRSPIVPIVLITWGPDLIAGRRTRCGRFRFLAKGRSRFPC